MYTTVGSSLVNPEIAAVPLGAQHLLSHWDSLLPTVRAESRMGLFSDFDGTLVPISRDPEKTHLSTAVRQVLTDLSQRGVIVAIVSGRPLEDLRNRVGIPDIWYVGEHGFSLYLRSLISFLTPEHGNMIAEVAEKLIRELGGLAGLYLERKDATVAVHYRDASRSVRERASETVSRALSGNPSLRLLRGKKVWELLPNSPVTKWTAIQHILRSEKSAASGVRLYLGDDATDETVFSQMKGITVAVGKHRRTSARYFLRSPAEVRRFLCRFAEGLA